MNFVTDRRNVFSCVTFAGDVERTRGVIGVDLEELAQRRVKISTDVVLRSSVTGVVRRETVTGANWIVDVEKMVGRVPGDRPFGQTAVVVHLNRSVFAEETEERRRTGSALQPEKHRRAGVAVLRGKKPEEDVRIVLFVHRQIPGDRLSTVGRQRHRTENERMRCESSSRVTFTSVVELRRFCPVQDTE